MDRWTLHALFTYFFLSMTLMTKSLAAAAVIATLGAGTVGTTSALAASHESAQNRMGTLVTALAQKFNLAPADVQAVVDQQHKMHKDAAKQAATTRMTAMLAQAVKNGKITQAQSDLIKTKQTEVIAFEASLQGKTAAERHTAITNELAALKTWATTNSIPESFISRAFGGMKAGFGREDGPRHGMMDRGMGRR